MQAIRAGKIKDRKSLEAFVSGKETEGALDTFKRFAKSIKGDNGYTPKKGVDYFTQKEIEAFKDEITPRKNEHYFDGKDGKNGKPGKDGRDGIDGKDGINGLDGKDGRDGSDGKDGSPDSGEQIIEKINSVKDALKKLKIDIPKNLVTKDILDRAISILDQRTSFLINKVSNLANVGVGGSAVYRNDGTISGTTITLTRNATTVLSLVVQGQFIHTFTHTSGGDTVEISSDEATGFNGNDYTVIFV